MQLYIIIYYYNIGKEQLSNYCTYMLAQKHIDWHISPAL